MTKYLTHLLFALLWKFGGVGLLALGILDSSFLFAPLGNDLLVIALSARYHSVARMLYYAGMSTIGSVLGVLLVDLVLRTPGERGLERHLSRRRIEAFKKKVTKNAAWALVVASIAPPPFPFTPFIMAAAALQYPRKRLLAVTGAARMVRFTGLGVLALLFGDRIIAWAENGVVQACIVGLLVLCVVGSAISVVGWIKRSRKPVVPPEEGRGVQPARRQA
jgi:membrane protein YqaA with SNARE-associated domain